MCSVTGDGNRRLLERLPLPMRPQVPETGGVPGQPEAPGPAGAGATGAAAGWGLGLTSIKSTYHGLHYRFISRYTVPLTKPPLFPGDFLQPCDRERRETSEAEENLLQTARYKSMYFFPVVGLQEQSFIIHIETVKLIQCLFDSIHWKSKNRTCSSWRSQLFQLPGGLYQYVFISPGSVKTCLHN